MIGDNDDSGVTCLERDQSKALRVSSGRNGYFEGGRPAPAPLMCRWSRSSHALRKGLTHVRYGYASRENKGVSERFFPVRFAWVSPHSNPSRSRLGRNPSGGRSTSQWAIRGCRLGRYPGSGAISAPNARWRGAVSTPEEARTMIDATAPA